MKILDCTLRDGGYYTDWNFKKEMVLEYVESVAAAGVDIVELGYISDEKDSGDFRDLRRLEKNFYEDLKSFNVDYSFMIDFKEHSEKSKEDISIFLKEVPTSFYSWCRIAVSHKDFKKCLKILDQIRQEINVKVAVNLMYSSEMSNSDLEKICKKASGKIDALYIADSYGSMIPKEVCKKIKIMKRFDFVTGVHFHDNLGLAFANTLVAIDKSVGIIDSTMSGMGRGVGNLKTEQIISYFELKIDPDKFSLVELVNALEKFNEMKKNYGWGWSLDFMASGCLRIHQKNIIDMREKNMNIFEILSRAKEISNE